MNGNTRPRPMTPLRACQVASKLLQQIEDFKGRGGGSERVARLITNEERDAIQVLRDATAKLIVHGLRPREENGRLHIPK